MSYSCLEELQVDLDLHVLDKTSVLSKVGRIYDDGWLVVTDDGICHLFDKDGNLDDIKKVTQLGEKHIRRDITKIAIPDSIMRIKKYAFAGCTMMTSVTIADSVTIIGLGAFSWCFSLTRVMIGIGVTSIGTQAFYGSSLLANLTFKGKTLEQVKKMTD